MTSSLTSADLLIRRLGDHGVRHVFGYPGGQLTPVYDALARQSAIRHILARDEQAAAFMADGYARATGRPGVCLAVCGPGVFNAATPLACSYTDSIPVLCVSGQVHSAGKGLRTGHYHENDQLHACTSFTKNRARIDNAAALIPELDRTLAAMMTGRRGPALVEIPVDVLRGEAREQVLAPVPSLGNNFGSLDVGPLAELVSGWRKPVLLAGGGVCAAGAEPHLVRLAERLGAPVFTTFMGKCAVPWDHPLALGLLWSQATSDLTNMDAFFSPLLSQADGVLAIGCRFSQACTGSWALKMPPALAQIDIDPAEIGRHYPVKVGLVGDALEGLGGLLDQLPPQPRQPWFEKVLDRPPWRLPGLDLIGPMRRVLPRDGIVAADITRLAYIMLADFPVYQPRTFLHPAGFVAMGYGIPAALGAKAAFPDKKVVAVEGDGCFLMCGMELASAVQENLPIVVVLLNDGSLTLIKAIQQRRYESRFIGVDLRNPDFSLLARAFGVRSWTVDNDQAFESALSSAVDLNETALIEVRL